MIQSLAMKNINTQRLRPLRFILFCWKYSRDVSNLSKKRKFVETLNAVRVSPGNNNCSRSIDANHGSYLRTHTGKIVPTEFSIIGIRNLSSSTNSQEATKTLIYNLLEDARTDPHSSSMRKIIRFALTQPEIVLAAITQALQAHVLQNSGETFPKEDCLQYNNDILDQATFHAALIPAFAKLEYKQFAQYWSCLPVNVISQAVLRLEAELQMQKNSTASGSNHPLPREKNNHCLDSTNAFINARVARYISQAVFEMFDSYSNNDQNHGNADTKYVSRNLKRDPLCQNFHQNHSSSSLPFNSISNSIPAAGHQYVHANESNLLRAALTFAIHSADWNSITHALHLHTCFDAMISDDGICDIMNLPATAGLTPPLLAQILAHLHNCDAELSRWRLHALQLAAHVFTDPRAATGLYNALRAFFPTASVLRTTIEHPGLNTLLFSEHGSNLAYDNSQSQSNQSPTSIKRETNRASSKTYNKSKRSSFSFEKQRNDSSNTENTFTKMLWPISAHEHQLSSTCHENYLQASPHHTNILQRAHPSTFWSMIAHFAAQRSDPISFRHALLQLRNANMKLLSSVQQDIASKAAEMRSKIILSEVRYLICKTVRQVSQLMWFAYIPFRMW